MAAALSIPDFAEEICKAVEQSASPTLFVVQQHRETLKSRLIDILNAQTVRRVVSAVGVEEQFRRLAKEWRDETAHLSSMTKLVMHPKYQSIIGLGPSVVPVLLRELRYNPDHWFWALKAVTGVNPTRPEDSGDLQKMTEAWLKWAEEKRSLQVPFRLRTLSTIEEYDHAVALLDELIDEVGEDERHPLASLMDTLGTLIEAYEDAHFPEPSSNAV